MAEHHLEFTLLRCHHWEHAERRAQKIIERYGGDWDQDGPDPRLEQAVFSAVTTGSRTTFDIHVELTL